MQQGKILIADDDAMLRLDLRTMLEALGYQVVGEAEDGEMACRLARSLCPDLVVLDVMMPGVNGLEAAEIMSKERLCAVIMLTAYSDIPIIEQANRAGVLAYLVKPFRQQELQPTIEIALSRYREMLALSGALDSAHEEMEANRLVARAKTVLIERFNLSDQEAHRRLHAQALATNRSLRQIAEAILLSEQTASHVTAARRTR